MGEFVTLSSGEQQSFETGARRDSQENKARYDLIPVCALRRLADLYARGARRYGEGNFERGIPMKRVVASLLRHAFQYLEGDRSEDHVAAVAWNAFALIFYEEQIAKGKLPASLDDLPGADGRYATKEAV